MGADDLRAYIRERQNGSDGAKEWSDPSCERHLNWVKQFWNWMLHNYHIEIPNLFDPARLIKKANTRQNRIENETDANLRDSTAECWAIFDAAEKDGYKMLAELILMGKYTGCRIKKLFGLKLEDAGPDYFQIQTGKTEASTSRLAIHSDIKQLVERLVQNSADGYLLVGSVTSIHIATVKGDK